MISIEQITPNPNQPRQQMGNLGDLTASIREKGILEPLIVRRRGGAAIAKLLGVERQQGQAMGIDAHQISRDQHVGGDRRMRIAHAPCGQNRQGRLAE